MAAGISIVEDIAERAVALEQCLSVSRQLHLTACFPSGAAALKAIRRRPPTCVLVDFRLGDMPALECVRRLNRLLPELLIIVFNAESELALLFESLQAGAVGFLDKHLPLDEILPYVHGVLYGGLVLSKSVGHALSAISQNSENFTERESEIYYRLMAGKRRKEVAHDLGITVNTVNTHLDRLFRKRGVHSLKDLVRKSLTSPGKQR